MTSGCFPQRRGMEAQACLQQLWRYESCNCMLYQRLDLEDIVALTYSTSC